MDTHTHEDGVDHIGASLLATPKKSSVNLFSCEKSEKGKGFAYWDTLEVWDSCIISSSDSKLWFDATRACTQFANGHLLDLDTVQKQRYLNILLSTFAKLWGENTDDRKDFWVSDKKIHHDFQFYSLGKGMDIGSPLTSLPYVCQYPFNGNAQQPTQMPKTWATMPPGVPQLCPAVSIKCDPKAKYRTIDGTCNNLKYPLRGSRNQPMARFVKASYRKANLATPNVRHLSQSLMAETIISDNRITALLVFWGQFVAHDITLVVGVALKNECYKVTQESNSCFNIQIQRGDQFYPYLSQMQMARAPECANRDQVTNTTGYMDGSQIYGGFDLKVAKQVRTFKDGLLLEDPNMRTPNKKLGFLPFGKKEYSRLGGCGPESLLLVGDPRGDENFMLTSLHTVFLRQHNRIARKLKEFHPKYTDEQLFQETRRIVVAIFQRISYEEWMPKVIGEETVSKYRGYKEEVDVTMHNGVATAAMRFGHAFIPLELRRHEPRGMLITSVPLNQVFCVPNKLFNKTNVLMVDEILRGAMGPYHGNDKTVSLNDHLSHHLFPKVQAMDLDLAALNIQRGRAHGLGSYGEYRKYCNLPELRDWFDFLKIIRGLDTEKIRKLKDMNYINPNDMDIWLAGLLEKPMKGAILGETFSCLLKKQFENVRDGDRFWYENNQFTPDQLKTIKGYTAGRLVCDNLDTTSNLRSHSFVHTDEYVKCSTLPPLKLELWK